MRTALKECNFVHLEFLSHKDGTTQYGPTYQIIEGNFQQTSMKLNLGVLEILCQFFNVQQNAIGGIDYDRMI